MEFLLKKNLFINLLLIMVCSFTVQGKAVNGNISFKPESRWFMQLGVQTGGDSTQPLPIYNRADGQLYLYSNSLTVVGPWTGISFDAYWQDEAEAGGFWKFEYGYEMAIAEKFTISSALGYQTDSIEGDLYDGTGGRGYFGMSRFTLDTIAFYNAGQHRFGIGAAYHFSPDFLHKEYSTGFKLKTDYDFDSALGAILQYDYLATENVSVGIRLTSISYDLIQLSVNYDVGNLNDSFSIDCGVECEELINADSFGIHMTLRF
jgi:hypothetical protein